MNQTNRDGRADTIENHHSSTQMSPAELIEAAHKLTPLLRETARKAESARKPLDEVIDAMRASGIFSLMVPKCYGGHEADLDTFFEVALILSKADASMGWLAAFYIEHAFWFCGFSESFQEEVFRERPYTLAPATLNVTGGVAKAVEGGYRLSGRWQWGTGIIHADWVLVGAPVNDKNGKGSPMFFALPRDEVEAIDTWHVAGMCSTGSFDIHIDDVFVDEQRVVSMVDLVNATSTSAMHDGPLYRTPLVPILGFASALSMLGAAYSALEAYETQMKAKISANELRGGGPLLAEGKPGVLGEAALNVSTSELILRDVLRDVMAHRDQATREQRGGWMSRMAHAVFMARSAVQEIASISGAGGSRLESPIQKSLRDISTGSNHLIFDRESRYADYGRSRLEQPIQSMLV